jgi:CRISPR/Cas system CSM-associated protein Csm2 small subunit
MLWIHKSIKNQILQSTFWNERILEIKLKINRGKLTFFFSLYAPEDGRDEEGENFYNLLQEAMNKVNKNDYLILACDLNARIGNNPIDDVTGKF